MKIIKYTSLLSVLFFLSATQLANAQNGVAIAAATATADGSAMLDVQSTSKGFLVPRMSTTNRTNISSPATGLLVYDNTVGGFFYWTGSAWVEISAGALSGSGTVGYDAAWSTTSALGNSNVFNNGTSVGIGSTIPNYKLDVAGSIGIANNNNTATNKLYLSSGDANHYIYSTGTSGNSMFFGEFGGVFNFYNTNSATTQVSFNAGAVSATGAINSGVGYTVGGLAGTGSYLRGNGTDFVSSAIQAGDIPSGSGNYVQNTTTQQASSNFNISGAGTMAGALSVGGAATVTGLVTANAGLKTSGSYYTLYGGTAEILANGDNHTGGGIAVSDDGGFYDFNDGYVTYLGSTGLRIAGNNGTTTSGNLQVVGLAGTGYRPVWTDASGNLTNGASNGNGRVWGSNGTQSAQQSTGTVSAYVSTGTMSVVSGELIEISGHLGLEWNGGSGTDHWVMTIRWVSASGGCGSQTINLVRTAPTGNANRSTTTECPFLLYWNPGCTGTGTFTIDVAREDADDNWWCNNGVIVANKQ